MKRTLLLRERGVASSHLVIPIIIYKERPSKGRSFLLDSGPVPVRSILLSDNLKHQDCRVCVFRGGVFSPGLLWGKHLKVTVVLLYFFNLPTLDSQIIDDYFLL